MSQRILSHCTLVKLTFYLKRIFRRHWVWQWNDCHTIVRSLRISDPTSLSISCTRPIIFKCQNSLDLSSGVRNEFSRFMHSPKSWSTQPIRFQITNMYILSECMFLFSFIFIHCPKQKVRSLSVSHNIYSLIPSIFPYMSWTAYNSYSMSSTTMEFWYICSIYL